MKTFVLISTIITCTLLGACSKIASAPTPNLGLGSALGDAPMLKGSIANLAEGDLAGKALELYAGIEQNGDGALEPAEALVQAAVAADGTFSLQLPGENVMTPQLVAGGDLGFTKPECNVTTTPTTHRIAIIHFALYADGELVGGELVASSNPQTNEAFYSYVDQDVIQKGGCTSGELGGVEVDMDLRKGWNTVVFSGPGLAYRTQALDPSYRWFIPFCTDGCPAWSGSE